MLNYAEKPMGVQRQGIPKSLGYKASSHKMVGVPQPATQTRFSKHPISEKAERQWVKTIWLLCNMQWDKDKKKT
jgi:hypothetical protein